jgi:alpha-galactosidase
MYTARQIMHFRNPVLKSQALLVAAALLGCASAYSEPAASARRWVDAKFLGVADPNPLPAHILTNLKSGTLRQNRIQDRRFLIAGKSFERGVAMPSPGEIAVRLPVAAERFEALVGVDSNDIGYYSNGGRGSVVASVEVNGHEAFRSPVLHEGLAAIPISVDLHGAREFTLKLTAVGERKLTDQADWDQADWAEARVTLAGGSRLWLADLPLGPLGGAFSTQAPFSFRYDGKDSAELLKSWRLERASRRLDAARTEHVATYTDPQTGLSVRCVGVAYSDFPVVEWTVYLKNTGSAPTPIVEQLQAIDSGFERTAEGEFLLHHSKGSPNSPTDFQPFVTPMPSGSVQRFVAAGGRPTDADLSYFNLEWAKQGVIVGLGWPGQWAATFTRDKQRGVRVAAGQELTHFRLLPGEEVRTPLVALLFWEGTWNDSQNVWRRWMIAHNLPRPGGRLPPPQFAGGSSRQTIEMQDANEENQKSFLNRVLKTGMKIDYWWMDAGWYPSKGWWNTGTWDPDPARFPNGFTPVSKQAHSLGVKIIVWFEPERVTAGSWLWERHPEWLLGTQDHDKLLFLGNPEARAWLTDHVARLISEQGIDTYRQDFNFPPLDIWRANDAPDRQGITENQHVSGYLAYWDALLQRFPNLLIDTCSSGGRRLDLETLRRSVPLWRSDYAYDPPAMQQLTYGLALWEPYFGTAFNSADPYVFWSQTTPAIGSGMDIARLESDAAQLRKLTGEWRSIAGLYYGDYYPLTPYSTEPTAWLAWQFNDPAAHKGMIQAFRRPESPFESARFRLSGLDPAASYAVRELDSSVETRRTGKSLMETGLAVAIGNRPGAAVLVYSKAQ